MRSALCSRLNTFANASLLLLACMLCNSMNAQAQTICAQQTPAQVNNNAYHVQNNEFNSSAQECINVNGTIFTVTQSAISNSLSGGPGAYPSIYKGCHWSNCTSAASSTTLAVSNLDIKAFTTDAAGRGYINSAWYLIAIEAGFELWQGGAGLSTNSFSTTVNNSLGAAPLNIVAPSDTSVLTGTVT